MKNYSWYQNNILYLSKQCHCDCDTEQSEVEAGSYVIASGAKQKKRPSPSKEDGLGAVGLSALFGQNGERNLFHF
jgi:hypothetical protein